MNDLMKTRRLVWQMFSKCVVLTMWTGSDAALLTSVVAMVTVTSSPSGSMNPSLPFRNFSRSSVLVLPENSMKKTDELKSVKHLITIFSLFFHWSGFFLRGHFQFWHKAHMCAGAAALRPHWPVTGQRSWYDFNYLPSTTTSLLNFLRLLY